MTAPPPPPAAPLAGDITINERLNMTLPLSLPNLSTTTSASSLLGENDPWDMPVPYTALILEWYGYRDPLNVSDAAHCVHKALEDTSDHLMSGDDRIPLGPLPYSYSHGSVTLWLQVVPGKSLLWGIWARIVYLVPLYGERNDWRGAQFVVFVEESGARVVRGHLLAGS
ncbi:MAG: hypothetical protein Q9161_007183 [Pseudevernia consocians]